MKLAEMTKGILESAFCCRQGRALLCSIWILTAGLFTGSLCAGKIGEIKWDESLSASLGYNSNINASQYDPIADFIFDVRFSLGGSWDITKYNSLTFSFGVGYRDYLSDNRLDANNVSFRLIPDSKFDFDVRVTDNITLKVSDSITFKQDPGEVKVPDPNAGAGNTLLDILSYERIQNTASIGGEWRLNKKNALIGSLFREDLIPIGSEFDAMKRTRYGANGRWDHEINNRWRGGLQGSIYENTYDIKANNDSIGLSYGVYADWQVSDQLSLGGHINWSESYFEANGQGGAFRDRNDFAGILWGVDLTHAFNPRMSWNFEFTHATDLGSTSNYQVVDRYLLGFQWKATREGQAYLSAGYEEGRDSGGLFREEWNLWFANVGYRQPIGDKLEGEILARYLWKNSSLDGRSYDQYAITLSLTYHFGTN